MSDEWKLQNGSVIRFVGVSGQFTGDDNSFVYIDGMEEGMSAKEQLAIEAAREYARNAIATANHDGGYIYALEGYLAGYAQAQADAAKLLDGVVRARDIGDGG